MSKANELAYPFKYTVGSDYGVGNYEVEATGLTKREYFAAMAMQGLLANPNGAMTVHNDRTFSPDRLSEVALLHADALIEALNK